MFSNIFKKSLEENLWSYVNLMALVSVKVEVISLEVNKNKSSPLCQKQTAPAANNFGIQILFYGRLL